MKRLSLLLGLLPLLIAGCQQVDFTAPGGSTLSLAAQPKSINKNATSILTVTGTRGTGAPLPDGTVVRFTVDGNLGVVTPNPLEMNNGIANATFIASQNSGKAMVKAISGDTASEAVEITIGDARASKLVLTATPAGLAVGGGKVKLKAFVLDEDGNPVSGIQVFFDTDTGTLSSGGGSVLTDASGIARDTLTTSITAHVSAESGTSVTDSIDITVGQGTPPTCDARISPSSVAIGQEVFFLDASTDDGRIVKSFWDFGDGSSAMGTSVSHHYSDAGTFTVTHTVTDDQGFTAVCSPASVDVMEGQPPACSFVASPGSPVDVGQTVSFADNSTDSDGQVVKFEWDFGDNHSTEGKNVTHSYSDPGTFQVLHTVTDNQHISDTCDPLSITVNFVGSPPTCSFTFSTAASPPHTIAFDSSGSTDPDGGSVSFQWDFGDGNNVSTANPLFSHTYASAGTFSVGLTVTDNEGDTKSCSQMVTVP